jgi:hypothetical protein
MGIGPRVWQTLGSDGGQMGGRTQGQFLVNVQKALRKKKQGQFLVNVQKALRKLR